MHPLISNRRERDSQRIFSPTVLNILCPDLAHHSPVSCTADTSRTVLTFRAYPWPSLAFNHVQQVKLSKIQPADRSSNPIPALVRATSTSTLSLSFKGSGEQFDRLSAQANSSHSVPVRAPVVTRSCTAVEHREAGSVLIRLVIPYGPRHPLGYITALLEHTEFPSSRPQTFPLSDTW
ncbi:hypothetical protein GQ457_16G024400 [Hibiscus cannabinus]